MVHALGCENCQQRSVYSHTVNSAEGAHTYRIAFPSVYFDYFSIESLFLYNPATTPDPGSEIMNFFTFFNSAVTFALVIAQLSVVYGDGEEKNLGRVKSIRMESGLTLYGKADVEADKGTISCRENDRPSQFLAFLGLAQSALEHGYDVITIDGKECFIKIALPPGA